MVTRAHASENSDPNIQQPASKALLARKKQWCPAPRPPVLGKGVHRRTHINDDAGAEADLDKCREALRASAEEQSKKDSGAFEEREVAGLEGSGNRLMMAKTLNTVPDSGAGLVKHLVQAFESLRCSTERLQPPLKEGSSSDLVNQLGPSTLCNSLPLDGKSNRSSRDRQTGGGRRSRRNPSETLRSRLKNKRLKVTSQHPFKLRTQIRGRAKVQQFSQKVQEMLIENEKKRIHIAQLLPWTTDEPECLIKPPVKERTEPIDLILHSDVRAVERAGFNKLTAERIMKGKQLRLEWGRQEKLEEEESRRQLRKELVPKAQPIPYFDRPFVPKRSTKGTTVPKEPNFHSLKGSHAMHGQRKAEDVAP